MYDLSMHSIEVETKITTEQKKIEFKIDNDILQSSFIVI